jgi:hypothetical protein
LRIEQFVRPVYTPSRIVIGGGGGGGGGVGGGGRQNVPDEFHPFFPRHDLPRCALI